MLPSVGMRGAVGVVAPSTVAASHQKSLLEVTLLCATLIRRPRSKAQLFENRMI